MPNAETMKVICSYCKAQNRVMPGRIGAICGRCREPLDAQAASRPAAPASPVTLTTANFRQEVLESDVPVLVDFWAPWCGPCRMIAPTLDALATQMQGRVKIGKLNVDEAQAIAQQYRVMSIPTLILFQRGREVSRLMGAQGADAIKRWLEQAGALQSR